MMDWDVTWLDVAGKQAASRRNCAAARWKIRDKMEDVMRAGANGEL